MDTQKIEGEKAEGVKEEVVEKKADKQSNLKMFLFGLVGLLALAVIVVAGVGIYKVYAKTSTDKFTVTVAKILHLPALKVGSETVSYANYVEDLKAINTMRDYDKANNGPGATLTDEQMSDQVLWRLANIILVNNAAKTYGLTIADQDVTDLKAQMMQQFKDEAAANTELEKRYGWNLSIYETKVMRPFILQNKLQEKIQADPKMKTDLQNQAQQVLDQIKAGADFAAMAQKYGSDSTAANGGDLGWFTRGEMVPQFEQTAFSLKKGELAPNLTETSYGYHIIKVTDTKTEKVKDPKTGKMVDQQSVRASHILFPFADITTYLNTLAKQTDIHLYLNVHNPFTDLKTATSTQQ